MFNPTNFVTQIVFCLYWLYHAREERKREREREMCECECERERERDVLSRECQNHFHIKSQPRLLSNPCLQYVSVSSGLFSIFQSIYFCLYFFLSLFLLNLLFFNSLFLVNLLIC